MGAINEHNKHITVVGPKGKFWKMQIRCIDLKITQKFSLVDCWRLPKDGQNGTQCINQKEVKEQRF